ncbi:hypothetical protein CTI12_AA314200 [Artemisia annua]|uniref:Retrovirus-related Pol polyprotein from transposon TNT 1-94-like beta-barrel domain-containing protein n=1 Tax=Artemisia annua TaxID=35608 RepID=A0A2U1N2V1_ARTAN|nr:hypothetical protein CTI12_AA314200 [Artemisia annua]
MSKISFGMVSTPKTYKRKSESHATSSTLQALNPTRTRKRERSREPNPRGWYLNSLATMHVCNSRDMFMDYRYVYGQRRIMGNTPPLDVIGKGTVMIRFKSGGSITLTDVLHVPTIKINLVSIKELKLNRFKFNYREADKEVDIYEYNYSKRCREILGQGYNKCGLYRLSINNEWPDANIIELD